MTGETYIHSIILFMNNPKMCMNVLYFFAVIPVYSTLQGHKTVKHAGHVSSYSWPWKTPGPGHIVRKNSWPDMQCFLIKQDLLAQAF